MKPTGNITFLFTDIEGSTKLAQDYPYALPAALEIHHSILTEAIESNNGFVFEIVGDAFCAAFENAEDAVKAAVEAQLKLSEEKWKDAVIKIRIGIHSGDAEWNGKRYMGYITLARTARVMSAAYGEQIIISNDVYEKVKNKIYDTNKPIRRANDHSEISFRDLGERRLKDVIQPVRLFQIVNIGLREDFPPLKTLDARPNNLPVQLTNFIGREEEIKHVKELLKDTHLLTLTGSGGAGKTRFALQTGADIIDDFANGVWMVELAAVNDPDFLPITIINALGLKEEPKKTPEETLTDYLKDKELLLILDNCEHLIEASSGISEKLLSSCPKLKILATSREALNCEGEQTYRIPSLSQPDPEANDTPEQLTQYESVRLFIERALSVNSKFRVTNENAPALAAICSHLDGIPLAIELAAARIKVLSLEKIYERLDDRFNLLTGGKRTALPRQQTLRAMIDWSYDLLNDKEKILWSRLSVFNGGWTLEATEEVCSDGTINKNEILDLLSQLTEKSIIIYDETNERYRILESIKQYGSEKLTDKNNIYLQHLNYFLELSEKTAPELEGENAMMRLDILEKDHNNFQSSIEWGVDNNNTEKSAQTAVAIGKFWNVRGYYSTGIKLLEIILNKPDEISKYSKTTMLNWKGVYNSCLGNYGQAEKYYNESLTIGKDIDDKLGIVKSLNNLGNLAFNQGKYEQAKKFFEESLILCKKIDFNNGISYSLSNLGNIAIVQGGYEQAKKFIEESMAIRKKLVNKLGIADSLNSLGNVSYYQGNYENAKKLILESLTIRKKLNDKHGIASSLLILGNIAIGQEDYEIAKMYHEESRAVCIEIGNKAGIAASLNNLGDVAYFQEDIEQAKKYYEEAYFISKDTGFKRGIAYSLGSLGNVSLDQNDFENAKKYLEESLGICKEIGYKHGITHSILNLGNLAMVQGEYEQAKKLYEESLKLYQEIGYKYGIARSLNSLLPIFILRKNYFSAIKILSIVEKVLNTIGASLRKDEQQKKYETIAKLHEQLSDEEFSKYREEGEKLSLEEACQLAVSMR